MVRVESIGAEETVALAERMTGTLWLTLGAITVLGFALRMVSINVVGFNTDEAVYASQAAGILNVAEYKPFFPVFRAHPLLFQFILALVYQVTGVSDFVGRTVSVAMGMATVLVVFALGRALYGPRTGLVAALFMALMPYHVLVTRQVLLDGPMVFFAATTLLALAQFGRSRRARWLYAAGLMLGLTILSKETAIIQAAAVFLFIALSPTLHVKARDILITIVVTGAVVALFPMTTSLAGATRSGQNYLLWQLLRRSNHLVTFYGDTALPMMGYVLSSLAALGVALRWRKRTWRETLLISWSVVMIVFFQIWPVKGFQYLLPMAPALCVLGAAALLHMQPESHWIRVGRAYITMIHARTVIIALVALSLAVPSWDVVNSSADNNGLAGAGGLPGGREVGRWFLNNTLPSATALAVGPSLANPIQFYGFRKTHMLSISQNPLQRNPSYEALDNPDLALRNGDVQYVVWDAYSASRSVFFAGRLINLVKRYHGREVHRELVNGNPVIIVYEVHP